MAQDGGLPHPGCNCPRCAAARGGQRPHELPACLGLSDGHHHWLIEATPALPEQLHRLSPAGTLDGILLTHAHLGHYLGLAFLGKEALGAHGLTLHGSPRMGEFLRTNAPWRALFDEHRATFNPAPSRNLGGLTAEMIPVPHRQEFSDTVAWLIRGPRQSLLWLPDIDSWDAWDRDLRELVASVDVAFLDATFLTDHDLPHRDLREVPHPRVMDTMARLAGLADRVRFIHLNHTNPLWDDETPATTRGFRLAHEGEFFPL